MKKRAASTLNHREPGKVKAGAQSGWYGFGAPAMNEARRVGLRYKTDEAKRAFARFANLGGTTIISSLAFFRRGIFV